MGRVVRAAFGEQNHSLLWQTHCSAAQGLTVIIEKDPFRLSLKRRDGSSAAATAQAEGFGLIMEERTDSAAK